MKYTGVIFALALGVAGLTEGSFQALKPTGEQRESIVFSVAGRPELVILQPTSPDPDELKALKELQDGLKQMTGLEFPVVREAEGNFISVGNTAKVEEWKRPEHPEGFRIEAREGSLYLLGGAGAGTLHAVLALLEEDLGCRWYGSGLNVYPWSPALTAEVASRTDAPAFVERNPFTVLSYSPDFCRRNRIRMDDGFGYLPGWFCHTYENIYPRTSFAEHPEYFMVDEAGKRNPQQLCPSRPELGQLAVTKVREALAANRNPARRRVSLSHNDYPVYCHCATCNQINAEAGGAVAGAELKLANQVAEAVAEDYPEAEIMFLAYHHTRKPPAGVTVADNIRILFCISGETDLHMIALADHDEVRGYLNDWHNLSSGVDIWDYMVHFQNYFMPYPSFGVIADNLRQYRELGCRGVMLQGKRECIGGDRVEMRAWVMAKLLWNPDRDVRELVRDFNEGVYGAAAPMMEEYYDLIEHSGREREKFLETFTDPEFIRRGNDCFLRARAALEAAGQSEFLPRLELAWLPLCTLELDDLARRHGTREWNSDRYRELLIFIKRVGAEHDVRLFGENVPMAKYLGNREILLDETEDGVIRIGANQLTAYRDIKAETVADPLAENGMAVRQQCNDTWSVQWRIPAAFLQPGISYRLRAKIRVSVANADASCWFTGVHDNESKSSLMDGVVPGNRLAAEHYQWVELGEEFVPSMDCYFWCAGVKSPGNAGDIWIESLELYPADK